MLVAASQTKNIKFEQPAARRPYRWEGWFFVNLESKIPRFLRFLLHFRFPCYLEFPGSFVRTIHIIPTAAAHISSRSIYTVNIHIQYYRTQHMHRNVTRWMIASLTESSKFSSNVQTNDQAAAISFVTYWNTNATSSFDQSINQWQLLKHYTSI